MEKNVEREIYLTISKSGIESTKKAAAKEAEETYGKTEPETKDTLLYPDTNWKVEEVYFDKDSESIYAGGEIFSYGSKLGYVSTDFKINSELLIEIIEHYMKKLGKLKTVMEAIK